MTKDLDKGESKFIVNNKRLELSLMRYMDREDKIEVKMKEIYGIVFRQ